jgi:cytochrome c-type biogenesis protein
MERALTSFLLGLLSTTTPCVLPLYPGFLAYLTGQKQTGATHHRYYSGLCVLAGVLTMMLALGGLIALLAIPISSSLALVIPIADSLILLLGVLLLLNYNPFKAIPQIQVPLFRRPLLNAYLYGLLYGPLTLPCSGPLVVGIFALSFTLNEAVNQLWLFIWFGLGLGVPLLMLTLLSEILEHRMTRLFARHTRLINLIGGVLLVGVALYDLWQNWEMLRLFNF